MTDEIQPVEHTHRRRTVAVTVLIAVALLVPTARLRADPPGGVTDERPTPPAATGGKSLDEQLLDDLNSDLQDDLDSLLPSGAGDPSARHDEADSDLDAQLIEQLLAGDDLGSGEDVDPLTRIGRRMQIAERRIEARQTSATTQRLQQKIVDDLARLIEEVRKSKCSGGEGNPGGRPADPKRTGQPGSSNTAGQNPATQGGPVKSTQRVERSESAEAKATRRQQLVKQAWGHLPERVRQQLPDTGAEEFLPKYADVIEEYFGRLAEEGQEGP